MKITDTLSALFLGFVFVSGLFLGFELMKTLEDNGYVDTKRFRLSGDNK